jgi:hypothetical protein
MKTTRPAMRTRILSAVTAVTVPAALCAFVGPLALNSAAAAATPVTPTASPATTDTAPLPAVCTAPKAVTTDPATLKAANVGVTILTPTPKIAGHQLTTGTSVAITASGWAGHGLHDISFYANGCLIGTDTTYPYGITWDARSLAGHPVSLLAQARDLNGIRVNSAVIDLLPTAVSPTAPPVTPPVTPTVSPTSAAGTPTAAPTMNVSPAPTAPAHPAVAPTVDSYGDLAAPLGGYFGTGSVWGADISHAPLNADSVAMANYLQGQVANYWGGTAAFNAYSYNESMVTAPAGTPTTTVIFDDCQHKGYTPAGLYGVGGQFVNVPIPATAVPASGTDGGLAVYSPVTNQLWSFWQAKHEADGWHACWGGRIDDVSHAEGYFTNGFGASASGLSSEGGAITIRDVESGSINHALSLAILDPAPYTKVVWPAQRSDGSPSSTSDIPEGTRFRLDPSLDVATLPGLTKIGRMVARAAQKYGFIVTDQAGAVSVVTESGNTIKAATGINPWDSLLGGTPSYAVMNNFPWAGMQAIAPGWGQPVTTPVVTSSWAISGPAAGGTVITVHGQNFVQIASAKVGTIPASVVACSTSSTCTIRVPAGTGSHYVYLTNSAGTNVAVAAAKFTYLN